MMDMRVKKTKRSIINAFLELRSKMPLEKIRVNELCRIAEINKSTFYAHYQDIYQLSEEVEQEVLQSYLNIPHPEYVLCNTEGFVRELFQAFYAHERLFHILFSGSRSSVLTEKIAEGIRELILRQYPQYADNPVFHTLITYRVYGSCYAFQESKDYGEELVISLIGKLAGQDFEEFDLGTKESVDAYDENLSAEGNLDNKKRWWKEAEGMKKRKRKKRKEE